MKNIFDLACFLLFYCFIFSMLSVFLMGLFCIGAYYVFFYYEQSVSVSVAILIFCIKFCFFS